LIWIQGQLQITAILARFLQATDLGNVLSEYENYPYDQYGMSFNIYWNRIWEILPEDAKTDIELRGSKTDFIVYLTFISLLSIPLIAFRSYQLWGWEIAILAIVFSWLLVKRFLYRLAVNAHANYSGYIESVFDIYRLDLAKKLGLPANLCPSEEEKKIWEEYAEFLQDNKKPTSAFFRAQDKRGEANAYDSAIYWEAKGNALFARGEYDEAIKCFDVAIRLDPDSVDAWTNKYLALQVLGKTSEADSALARATGLRQERMPKP